MGWEGVYWRSDLVFVMVLVAVGLLRVENWSVLEYWPYIYLLLLFIVSSKSTVLHDRLVRKTAIADVK